LDHTADAMIDARVFTGKAHRRFVPLYMDNAGLRRRLAMPVDFRALVVNIPVGTGFRTIPSSVTFGSNVNRAVVTLNGFQLNFVNGARNIDIVKIDTDIDTIVGQTVNFNVRCNYADQTANDDYLGYITAAVIAEIEP
jgi:hypothetical protein